MVLRQSIQDSMLGGSDNNTIAAAKHVCSEQPSPRPPEDILPFLRPADVSAKIGLRSSLLRYQQETNIVAAMANLEMACTAWGCRLATGHAYSAIEALENEPWTEEDEMALRALETSLYAGEPSPALLQSSSVAMTTNAQAAELLDGVTQALSQGTDYGDSLPWSSSAEAAVQKIEQDDIGR
ncbi:hypothetical protein K523DRAFT_328108, partial [Schizophyllum commune Tattone D]